MIFLKFPEPGQVKTRLAADIGDAPAAHVYRLLAERTLKALISGNQFRVNVFFTPLAREKDIAQWLDAMPGITKLIPQTPGDLGARMADAFHKTFADSDVEKVIVIGTDCPRLDLAIISEAFDALDRKPAVVGPAVDGGYYLLGLNDNSPWLFEDIAWSTAEVFTETINRLKKHNVDYALLSRLGDIDTIHDLRALWPDWEKDIRQDLRACLKSGHRCKVARASSP